MQTLRDRLSVLGRTIKSTPSKRFFLTGILCGGVFGLFAGSLVAFQVGTNRETMRDIVIRRQHRHASPQKLRMV